MPHIALQLSGFILIGGASLLGMGIVTLSFQPVIKQLFSPRIGSLLLMSSILLLLSLPGVYATQANSSGWVGLIGHALLQCGVILIVVVAAPPLLYPSLKEGAGNHPVTLVLGVALTLGLLLTGIATIQAGVFPRWTGILLLAATAGFFFVFFVAEFLPPIAGQIGSATFGLLLALALAGLGYSTLTFQAM